MTTLVITRLGSVRETAEQVLDDGDVPEGEVIAGELVVAGPQGPPLLVPPNHPLDDVAPPVAPLVEIRLTRLVRPRRDDRGDVAPPQPAAHARKRVPLVPGQLSRPAPRPAAGGQDG